MLTLGKGSSQNGQGTEASASHALELDSKVKKFIKYLKVQFGRCIQHGIHDELNYHQ